MQSKSACSLQTFVSSAPAKIAWKFTDSNVQSRIENPYERWNTERIRRALGSRSICILQRSCVACKCWKMPDCVRPQRSSFACIKTQKVTTSSFNPKDSLLRLQASETLVGSVNDGPQHAMLMVLFSHKNVRLIIRIRPIRVLLYNGAAELKLANGFPIFRWAKREAFLSRNSLDWLRAVHLDWFTRPDVFRNTWKSTNVSAQSMLETKIYAHIDFWKKFAFMLKLKQLPSIVRIGVRVTDSSCS